MRFHLPHSKSGLVLAHAKSIQLLICTR